MPRSASDRQQSERPLGFTATTPTVTGIRAANMMAVFDLLFPDRRLSRVELGKAVGISRMAINDVTAEMTDRHLIRETGPDPRSGRGKRSAMMAVDTAYWRVIAVDLTDRFVLKGALCDLCGRIVDRAEVPCGPEEGDPDGAGRIAAAVALVERLRGMTDLRVLGVGAASPGIVAGDGTVVSAVRLGWTDLPLRGRLEHALGLPVTVSNATRMALVAERYFGEGSPDSLLVHIGPGVGAALCIDDRIVEGRHFTAGEIGHIPIDPDGPVCTCGKRGCLETFLSAPRLQARLDEAPERRTRILAEAGRLLGRVLTVPAGLLDLRDISVYGPAGIVGETFLGAMGEELAAALTSEYRVAPRLHRCQQGEDLVLRGLAVTVIRASLPTIRETAAG